MSRYTARANLLIDGYERVAATMKRNFLNWPKTLVIAPSGRAIYFHGADEVPERLQKGIVGRFTKDCPVEVIEDALIEHLRELTKTMERGDE